MATLQNTTINSTGFLTIPVGNTTQRPGSPTNGMLRFNTDTGQIEVYNSGATAWGSITGPTISQIQITDSSYNVLDDTAVNTSGGYIKITGTGFGAGAVVVIGGVNATSTTVVNSTTLNVQVPAQVAGTYTIYVVNTNGGTAIGVNGLTYSALPNWVTASTLPNGLSGSAISIQLNATDATSYALAPANTLPTGLTLTSGGLLSGTVTVGSETTYSFTIIATDAQLQDSPRAFTISITAGDPYFYLTTLLLAGNGTNNGTNNTFVDGSTNALAITRNGNTTQGTFSPFSQTGWSNYFDGSGDYLSIADNAALDLGTGDFTIECWVYPVTGISNVDGLIGKRSQSTFTGGDWRIAYISASTAFGIACGSNSTDRLTPAITLNAWNHIAFVRSSGTLSCYANGVRGANLSWTDNLDNPEALLIGLNTAGYDFPGYISNVRIVKGTGVYSGATYTVPITPLTAIANTSLLTCQNNRFIDNSTNNFTITRNGDVSVQSFSPFAPGSSYSAGTVGGSSYYDGTGDYLTFPSITLSGAFTAEAWVYHQGSNNPQILQTLNAGSGAGFQLLRINNGYQYTDGLGATITGNVAVQRNCWNHLAITRDAGGTIRLFTNGVLSGSATPSVVSANAARISGVIANGNDVDMFTGYISGVRIINGNAIYTSTFTPPTSPPTNIANTSLLCNFTNAQIFDQTAKIVLETVGDAKVSTAQYKYGSASMYFDGTGDYLFTPANKLFAFRTGDFTIEFWIRSTDSAGNLIGLVTNASGNWNLVIAGSALYWQSQYATTNLFNRSATGILDGAWHHVAITRASGTMRMFFDGTLQGATASDSTDYTAPNALQIGSSGVYGDFLGYIDDLRITKGYARYTSNFTAPTAAFPDK